MTMKSKLIWAIAGGLLVLGAVLLYSSLQTRADPPILVGDGSMVIESLVPINDILKVTSPNVLTFKNVKVRMHKVKHRGGSTFEDCGGKGNCTETATWTNGSTLVVSDVDKQAITITSSEIFDNWDKYTYTWVFRFDPALKVTLVDVKVTPDQIKFTTLCQGKDCKAEIEYKE